MAQLLNTNLFTDSNLVAYYRLEDISDSKGSNTLTNNGSIAFNPAQYANGADLGETNTSKYLSRPDSLGIGGNSEFSVAFWIKLRTEISSGLYRLISFYSQIGADRYLIFNYEYNAGALRLTANAAGGTTADYTVTLGTSTFHHVAVTRSVSGNALKLYFDGTLVASGTIGTDTAGDNQFLIGSVLGGGSYASALIDDMGIFNRVLTATEIGTLYNILPGGAFFFTLT